MSDPIFFVVRTHLGKQAYSVEHGDHSSRYGKENKAEIAYRVQLPEGSEGLPLDFLIQSYEAGVRLKPPPAPPATPAPPKPRDVNSIREKYLAKLRAEPL